MENYLDEKLRKSLVDLIAVRRLSVKLRTGGNNIYDFVTKELLNDDELVQSKDFVYLVVEQMWRGKTVDRINELNKLLQKSKFIRGIEEYATDRISNEEFEVLVKYLYSTKDINKKKEYLKRLCSDDIYRNYILTVFAILEKSDKYTYFTLKNNSEIWINFTSIINSSFDKGLIPLKDRDGYLWPWGVNAASLSSIAAFLKFTSDRISLNVEFASYNCRKKDIFLKILSRKLSLKNDGSEDIILIFSDSQILTTYKEIANVVDNLFIKLGEIEELISQTSKEMES